MFQRVKIAKITIFFILFFMIFLSCDFLEKYTNKERYIDFDKDAYNTNLKKWQDHDIKDYKFDYHIIGSDDFSSHYRIYVRNGLVDSAEWIDFNGNVIGSGYVADISNFETINKIFEKIIDRYNKNNGKKVSNNDCYYTAFIIDYDSTYGFPTKIVFDEYVPENVADAGASYHYIKNFEPL